MCNMIYLLIKLYHIGIFSRDYPIYFLLNSLTILPRERNREKERENKKREIIL